MKDLKRLEVWFVTGSQHLYGDEVLEQVAGHSQQIARALSQSKEIPIAVVFKPVLTTPDAIYKLCLEANSAENCVGLITWMHTFSPARMWIAGLKVLQKPFVHLHRCGLFVESGLHQSICIFFLLRRHSERLPVLIETDSDVTIGVSGLLVPFGQSFLQRLYVARFWATV